MDSRRILTLDSGNSRMKVSLFEGSRRVGSFAGEGCDFRQIERMCGGVAPEGVICSVVGRSPSESLLRSIGEWTGRTPLILRHDTPLPIKLEYATRSSLGADRIAGAAGAAALFPGENLLIADAGTALTLDILDSEATFRGGNISPGISLRFRALNEFTAALPLAQAEGPLPLFGHDTLSAIRCGVIRGTAAEICGAWRDARRLYGVSRLVLSGGDAALVAPLVSADILTLSLVPDLVEVGLISIFNHNVSL